MKISLVILGTFFFALAAAAAPERLRFGENGFTIFALEDTSVPEPANVLTMTLPSPRGYAPNVSVNVQLFTKPLADFVKLSEAEFKESGFKTLLSKKLNENSHVWEYTGKTGNSLLHFYAKVILTGKKAYLATAIATDPQWVFYGEKLKVAVDSLKLDL